jgi:hypothetical protein
MSWASSQQSTVAPRQGRPVAQRGPAVRHLVVSTLALVVASVVIAVLAFLIAGPTGNPSTFAVLSTLLGLPVLVYLVRWRTVAALRGGVPAVPWVLAAAVLAYVVSPVSWGGTALFWWTLVDPGPLAFALDLPVWAAAAGLGILWGGSQQKLVVSATPYG